MKPKVYFTKEISPAAVLKLYKLLGKELTGNIAIKVHSGEQGNPNFMRPAFWKDIVDHVGGTIVECNTAYEGTRNTTERHVKLLKTHGWSAMYPVDLLDAQGPDMVFDIPQGKRIKKNFVGKDLANYDSTLILSHFKGHPMGGYGGALKQLSIGFASSYGKGYIHGVGDPAHFWDRDQDQFLESMADAAWSVVDYFKGNAVYVNVMKNMSVDCDCVGEGAQLPKAADIGILISDDPVAIDQACLDLLYAADDPGKADLIERIESRHGVHTIEIAVEHGIGSREYELITVE